MTGPRPGRRISEENEYGTEREGSDVGATVYTMQPVTGPGELEGKQIYEEELDFWM